MPLLRSCNILRALCGSECWNAERLPALFGRITVLRARSMEVNMRKNKDGPRSSEFYRAILTLKTEEECRKFFDDICSVSEILAMEQRYEVARRLHDGLIYSAIMEETGASSAIISRVNRSIQYGVGGYEIVFNRLDEKK